MAIKQMDRKEKLMKKVASLNISQTEMDKMKQDSKDPGLKFEEFEKRYSKYIMHRPGKALL